MSADRELLLLAAKAAGIALWPVGTPWRDNSMGTGLLLFNGQLVWNPLADDGEALRLAVDLQIQFNVVLEDSRGWVESPSHVKQNYYMEFQWEIPGDRYTATRRAIVRAAAAIGRAMPC
jgi:hypothetical protein